MADLLWFGFWLGLCGLVGMFAQRKGRSGLLAFFASMIVSPLIIAIIVLIVPRKATKDEVTG